MSERAQEATLVPVAMIAAVARNGVIGVEGKLPWYLPEDLKFFKRMTQGKPLVMGRKTFASIGRPLPGRLNIVVTRDESFDPDGVRVCHDLASALALADRQATIEASDEIMVMGGGEIYAQALPHASRLYLTEVEIEVDGDARFPALDPAEWEEVQRVPGEPREGQPAYRFVVYRRCQGGTSRSRNPAAGLWLNRDTLRVDEPVRNLRTPRPHRRLDENSGGG